MVVQPAPAAHFARQCTGPGGIRRHLAPGVVHVFLCNACMGVDNGDNAAWLVIRILKLSKN